MLIEEIYHDDLSLLDIRLAARFYPLGDASEIRPYVGGGSRLLLVPRSTGNTSTPRLSRIRCSRASIDTLIDEYEGTDTAANGFFPFVTAGVTIPIGSQGELLLDFQYDFEKEDDGFDLGGPIYMIGGRFRF